MPGTTRAVYEAALATAIRTTSPAAFRRYTLPRLVGPAATPPIAMAPDTVTDGTSTSSVAVGRRADGDAVRDPGELVRRGGAARRDDVGRVVEIECPGHHPRRE